MNVPNRMIDTIPLLSKQEKYYLFQKLLQYFLKYTYLILDGKKPKCFLKDNDNEWLSKYPTSFAICDKL